MRSANPSSPLEEIERQVQETAAQIGLDMAAGDAGATLRRLVAAAIEAWSNDHKRGLRPFDLNDPDRLAERVFRNLAGYGPLEELLSDEMFGRS